MIVRRRRRPMGAATALLSAVLAFAAVAAVEASSSRPALAAAGDWPTYLHDPQRTAADRTVTGLSPSIAPNLVQRWADRTGGAVLSSPTVVGGVVYVGSGDGYEYALNATTGATIWKTFLGVTSAPDCNPPIVGVSSAATVQDGVLYAGGGDAYWYALDAATGVVLWRVFTGDNSATGGHYNWSSPLIYNGFGYIGIASLGDCPLVQGQLLQVSLSTHTVTRTLDIVPPGRVGGGIWTSPAVEAATNTLFVTTGTQEFFLQPMIQAMVALDATTLAVKGAWQIPPNRAVVDSDWGTTPILFTDAAGTRLVAAINKDGYAYAFRRDDVGAGPVWDQRLAFGGTCPICGEGSVSSGAFDGSRLYFAGGSTMIRGLGAAGSVRALDPATGIPIWEHRAAGAVVPALAYANGLVIAAGGPTLEVLSAATGARLYSFTTGNSIYSAASVSNGMIYFGSTDGYVYALGTRSPTVPPSDPTCPSGWTCQDIGGPSPPGRQTVSGDRWTVAVGGSGVAGLADQFRLISQNLNEDGRVLAQVTAMPGPGTGAQGGVMVRQRNDPGAPYYALLAGPSGLRVQYRTRFGAPAVSAVTVPMPRLPAYLEIVRTGDLFQAATSADGVTFTLVPGGDFAVPMPATVMAGVATTSQAQGTDATASYAAVAVAGPGAAPVPPPTPSPCPSGWSCAGVGNPTAVGDQSLAGGRWTVKGAGVDLIGYTDQLHLAWRSLGTAGTISATVTSLTAPTGGARAGPMIRQSASDPGSIFYAAVVVPGGTLAIIDRPHQGLLVQQVMTTPLSLPASIQIARTGDTYCTYTSAGGGGWTYLPGSCTTLDPSSTSVAGLAVTSGAPAALATATFDAVSMSATPPPLPTVCPSGWNCGDIGYPTPPGSQSVSGGVWTIVGSGSDIWFPATRGPRPA